MITEPFPLLYPILNLTDPFPTSFNAEDERACAVQVPGQTKRGSAVVPQLQIRFNMADCPRQTLFPNQLRLIVECQHRLRRAPLRDTDGVIISSQERMCATTDFELCEERGATDRFHLPGGSGRMRSFVL